MPLPINQPVLECHKGFERCSYWFILHVKKLGCILFPTKKKHEEQQQTNPWNSDSTQHPHAFFFQEGDLWIDGSFRNPARVFHLGWC